MQKLYNLTITFSYFHIRLSTESQRTIISIRNMPFYYPYSIYQVNRKRFFANCTSLEKIIFGTGLKTGGVFWDSKYIKEIHCRSTIPPSIIGFNNEVYNNATLYVPKGCNEAYHTAIMWREFKTIVEE